MMQYATIKIRPFFLFAAIACAIFTLLPTIWLMSSMVAFANDPTYVSGGIFADTTWSESQSPYIVTDTVVLFPGYTLTVEPGVEVRFYQNTSLIIRGTLVAEGTSSNTISFTTDFVPIKGSWNGIQIATNQGGNASVKFASISYAVTGLSVECCWGGGPANISDSGFYTNEIALGGYAGWDMQVERCIFENNTYAVTRADKEISDSIFRNNVYGLYETERISVDNSDFFNNEVALYGGREEVIDSRIIGNDIGVMAFFEGFSLLQNTIANNTVGVILGYDSFMPSVSYNNIFSNTEFNMRNTGPFNKDAGHNWWGTTNTDVIDEFIYDGRDDISLGLVIYEPILHEPWGEIPPQREIWQFLPFVVNKS